jgi:hypothetical protein
MKTKSQILFEKFCQMNGIDYKEIPVSPSKTADYEIKVKSQTMICEVKELTPNDEDKRLRKKLDEKGSTGIYESKIRKRLFGVIQEAAEQLKPYKNCNFPLIVAVYDNIVLGGHRVHLPIRDREFDEAMYGISTGRYLMSSKGIHFDGFFHGGERRMTATEKKYISAVFLLKDQGGQVSVNIYHNYFASVKIDMNVFDFSNIRQFYHKNEPRKCSVDDLVCF